MEQEESLREDPASRGAPGDELAEEETPEEELEALALKLAKRGYTFQKRSSAPARPSAAAPAARGTMSCINCGSKAHTFTDEGL